VNDPVRQRVLDAAAVVPSGSVVGGWAAAYLQGVAYLDGRDEPVMVFVGPGHQVNRPGIVSVRSTVDPADVVVAHGLACTAGTRTTFDVLRLARDLTTAVISGDCLLHAGLTTSVDVLTFAASHPRRRGLRQLRTAVPLLDAAAASPPESRLRMLCRLRTELPPLLVNTPVHDRYGQFLGIPDLLEPRTGLAIEYDGEYHRELAQHTADNLREEALESAGLTVIRVTSIDLPDESVTARRISATHRRLLRSPVACPTWQISRRV
jgi:hypothetical protein